MIEVLFDESEAALMKVAIEKGVIEGDKDKVICLALMLDIGDIKQQIDSDYRKNLILNMYTQNSYDNSKEVLKELKEAIDFYMDEQKKLKKYIEKGEKIRIWYSNAPYSMCGFYYVCNMIKDNDNKISTIKLPEYIQIKDRVISYQHFGEVAPEKFNLFTKYEKKMSNIELEMFSNNWTELVKDNSPLRAVVNGQLIGVPINFYDYLIYKNYKNLGYEPIKEAGLIGNILGYYPVGIRDYWYAYRIEEMIKNKKIEIVEDCEKKYARSIKIR